METGKPIINVIKGNHGNDKAFDAEDKQASFSIPKTKRLVPPICRCIVLLVTVGFLLPCAYSTTAVQGRSIMSCIRNIYTQKLSKRPITRDGIVMTCFGTVNVKACYGRCDTYEYGNYEMPYKTSKHTVCTYGGFDPRRVRLGDCHPDYPDPYVMVFDAKWCGCGVCNPDYTSCENLNG